MRYTKLVLPNKSIPVWFSFAGFFVISTLVFGFCFAYLFPIAEIPSDDTVYGANLVAVSNCFADAPKNNPFCIPGPSIPGYANSVNYLKPTLGFLGGLVHAFLRPFYPFTGVDILSLLNFVSLSIAVSLMCAVLANTKPFASILTFLFIACSVTIHGTLIWTGYSFIVLLFLVLIFTLHSRQDKQALGYQIALSSLLALLFFVHLSTLPWIIAYFSIFVFQSYRGFLQVGKASYYPLIRILTITAILVFVVDRLGATYGSMPYVESYFTAYELNVSSASQISASFAGHMTPALDFLIRYQILDRLSILLYYFSVEPLLLMLFVISAIACKSKLRSFVRDFSNNLVSLFSSPYGMAVGVTLMASLIISMGQTEKLLRLFVPAHLGFCIVLSFLISNIYLKCKNSVRIVIFLCLLAFFQFSFLENFHQYLQRASISRTLDGFSENKANLAVVSFQSDPLIKVLLSGASKNPLWPFYPKMNEDKKENYLGRKMFTNDYYRFHLVPDREHALRTLRVGDFLLTSEPLQNRTIGYVESVKLVTDKSMKVNQWQTSIGPTASMVDMLSGKYFDGFVHVGKHLLGSDLSDQNLIIHLYQKCGSFEGYVNKYDDLLATYDRDLQEKSKHEWGKNHYCTYGIEEGRTYSWLSEASCLACNR